MLAASCGTSKKPKKKAASTNAKDRGNVACLVDCIPQFGGNNGDLGSEGPIQQPTSPGKYEPGKYEPGKYEPGKYEPGKSEPGKYEPITYPPTTPTPPSKVPTTPPTKVPVDNKPTTNACLDSANSSIVVGGYTFYMTRYTTKFYTTIGSSGIRGNYVTILDGRVQSINNSFTHYVKDGVFTNSGGSSMTYAEVTTDEGVTPFASIEEDPAMIYNVGGKQYDVAYNLATEGACLARYGAYSGGYPVLVLP